MFTALRILSFAPNCQSTVATALAGTLEAQRDNYLPSVLNCQHFMGQTFVECQGFTHVVENLNYSADAIAREWPRLEDRAASLAHNPEALANAAYAAWTDDQGHVHDPLGNGPEGNGNGWRYRGRGIIQITGLYNYTHFGKELGLDLVADPDLAMVWSNAALIALHFWKEHGCNPPSDQDNVQTVTQHLNGGLTSLEQRIAATAHAKKVFT